MQDSTLTRGAIFRTHPQKLGWLMDLYERNYQALHQLLGSWDVPWDHARSESTSDLPLLLDVIDRAPYTLELRLTYAFDGTNGPEFKPDCYVRVYQDARMVEALQVQGRPPWLAGEGEGAAAMRYWSSQWRRNMMLHKWLEYLLHHGHGFAAHSRPAPAPIAAG